LVTIFSGTKCPNPEILDVYIVSKVLVQYYQFNIGSGKIGINSKTPKSFKNRKYARIVFF